MEIRVPNNPGDPSHKFLEILNMRSMSIKKRNGSFETFQFNLRNLSSWRLFAIFNWRNPPNSNFDSHPCITPPPIRYRNGWICEALKQQQPFATSSNGHCLQGAFKHLWRDWLIGRQAGGGVGRLPGRASGQLPERRIAFRIRKRWITYLLELH